MHTSAESWVKIKHKPCMGASHKPCIGASQKPCIGASHKPCIGASHKPCIGASHKPCIGASLFHTRTRTHLHIHRNRHTHMGGERGANRGLWHIYIHVLLRTQAGTNTQVHRQKDTQTQKEALLMRSFDHLNRAQKSCATNQVRTRCAHVRSQAFVTTSK